MKGFLRRLRGIIGTGLVWGLGFVGLNSLVLLVQGRWETILPAVPVAGLFGFVLGSGFGGVLSLTERNRKLEDLSLPRVGVWGAIAGSLVSAAVNLALFRTFYWEFVGITALLSAGFSTGSVALAKRGERKLIEGEDNLPALEGE